MGQLDAMFGSLDGALEWDGGGDRHHGEARSEGDVAKTARLLAQSATVRVVRMRRAVVCGDRRTSRSSVGGAGLGRERAPLRGESRDQLTSAFALPMRVPSRLLKRRACKKSVEICESPPGWRRSVLWYDGETRF